MKQRQQKLVLLMSLMAVGWSLSHGCPIGPGPTCLDELPNAISIISRLKKSLKDFYKILVDEGYGVRELRGPVCTDGSREQSMDVDTRLCQYSRCFQHFAGIVGQSSSLQPSIEYCQKYLNQLENTIKKMRPFPSDVCTVYCSISWSSTGFRWQDLIKGPHLAQEFLAYLEQLNLSCSSDDQNDGIE